MSIKKSTYKEDVERPSAVFETSLGVFEADLYAKECPQTVWNFINLAEGRQETEQKGNFYDGLTFHRVIEGFVIQGGCPLGNGTGGPGYQFKDEFVSTEHILIAMTTAKRQEVSHLESVERFPQCRNGATSTR